MALDTGNNIVTLAETKSYLGLPSTTTTYDARLTDIINYVSHRFNTETNRKLKSRSNTEYYDGNGDSILFLNEYPIVSNSTNISIWVDTDRTYATTSKIASADIVIYSSEGKVWLDDDCFDQGNQSVKVTYTAGYTLDTTSTVGTMPHDLRYAAKEMVRLFWNREKGNRAEVRSESVSGASIVYEQEMPYTVKKVLENYRDRYRAV